MRIARLSARLEKEINSKMNRFVELSKEVEFLRDNASQIPKLDSTSEEIMTHHTIMLAIHDLYFAMATIAKDLEPVESVVLTQYPEFESWFSGLKNLFKAQLQNRKRRERKKRGSMLAPKEEIQSSDNVQ